MDSRDYYAILGVPVGASAEQIERAYKLLARMSHPDAFPNNPRAQAWANERMKQINEAYAVLADPARRSDYDRIYSGRRTAPGDEPNEQVGKLRCPACEGEGEIRCLTCQGSGNEDCPGCHGQQFVTCPACFGVGTLTSHEYERLVEELLRAAAQGQRTATRQNGGSRRVSGDPFWQPGYWDRPQRRHELRPAPLLSFLIPGVGQLYNQEPQKAATYFGIAALLFLGIGLLKGVGLLLFLCFWVYNIYDAHAVAERRSEIETRKGG